MSSALHKYITGGGDAPAAPLSTNKAEQSHSSGEHQNNDVSVTNMEQNTCNINVTRNRLDNDMITGILSGAIFNGQVVINFNMPK